VKIILKFSASVENQGISPSPLMQVLSGFCLKGAWGSEMEEVLFLILFHALLSSIQK